MKLHLPKSLLSVVVTGMLFTPYAYAHSGFTVKEGDVVTVDTNTSYSALTDAEKNVFVQGTIAGTNNTTPYAVAKDGEGTLSLDSDVKTSNPLFIREGSVYIGKDATLTASVKTPTSFISNLSVGGKNASLVLDGGKYIQTIAESNNSVSPAVIGNADGAGSLELKNGATFHTDHFVFAGYQQVKDFSGNPRVCGGYTAGTGYVGGDAKRSSIVINDSVLSAGTSFQFADVDITVTNGSTLKDNARGLANKNSNDPGSWFGAGVNCSTVINVTDKSKLQLNWLLQTSEYDGSKTTINVSGEGSSLEINDVDKKVYLSSSKNKDAQSAGTTAINITDGATATVTHAKVGQLNDASIMVGTGSSYTGGSIVLGGHGELIIGGSMTITEALEMETGSVITFMISDLEDGLPVLTVGQDDIVAAISEGDAITGLDSVTFQLMFTDNALSQMETGMDLDIDALLANIDKDLLVEGTQVELVNDKADEIFSETTITMGGAEGTTTSVKVVGSIPEPTTATLSLLALAALAGRRRRK